MSSTQRKRSGARKAQKRGRKLTGAPRRKAAGPRRRRKPARRSASLALRYCADAGVFILTALVALAFATAWFARDLPSTDNLWRTNRNAEHVFLTMDGAPISRPGAGAPVRLAALPAHVPGAILAIEDRNFRHHVGVNPFAVGRAFLVNAAEGSVRQGGSTITQQLAKNLFLSSDRTVKRKVQELMLALWLERRFTKDEILTLYLNRVYFGAGAYGIDAASRRYFDKPAARLDIAEAAVLAGLLKAPSRYAPSHNPQIAGARARLAIDAMVETNVITRAQAQAALSAPVRLKGAQRMTAPYFVDFAQGEAARLAGAVDADLVIKTTLDPAMQTALEAGVRQGVARAHLPAETQVAAVIVSRDGAVKAMLGGRDYAASQFNRAVQARRQPGSAFKPFVYLSAFERGASPGDQVLDAPLTVAGWSPDNYESRFYGPVTLTEALARSLNAATVRVQERFGRNAVRVTARRMGVDAPLTKGPALALGVDAMSPLALAGAYAPFANGGFRISPHAVQAISTVDGQSVYKRSVVYEDAAASETAIEKTNAMLAAVAQWGTGKRAALNGVPVYGKTGTTQGNRDAWFAGHAGGFVCVVWIGRDDNAPMAPAGSTGATPVTGGTAPAIIWRLIMEGALETTNTPPSTLAPDAGITTVVAPLVPEDDPLHGFLARTQSERSQAARPQR